ncbi:MoaD/ThiS family protein [Nesterenkonia suensis]
MTRTPTSDARSVGAESAGGESVGTVPAGARPEPPATGGTLTVRLFAAAAEAAGAEEVPLPLAGTTSLAEVLRDLPVSAHGGDAEQLAHVLGRCSFLVNGVRAAKETTRVAPGDQLDVLPPFAGG